ncbi:MAG TPA: cation transporter [Succinivibrionaceae bacterium]|nr:cation transporter [Succinivibrionaceae bacterium]
MSESNSGKSDEQNRDSTIIKTSIIGIATNILLAAFKAVIGILSNSIAITLDAVNNLSDALSSIVTIIGTKLAGRLPDKKHPFGYGRLEYLSAMIVSGIILYAGITSAVESVKKIIYPENPDYDLISLIIIAVAVAVKVVLGRYVKNQGEKVHSGSLIASGQDAMFDAILSFSVLASAILFMFTDISLEAYVGAVISLFIVKAGIEIMRDTINEILGLRADKSLTDRIKRLINEEKEVLGAYDLVMYNYGPDKNYASVHVQLPDVMTVKDVDRLTRKLETRIYRETGVILAGVGVYSFNTQNDEAAKIFNQVQQKVVSHSWAVQIHGFYIDLEIKEMRFDVVFSFDISPDKGLEILYREIREDFPSYNIRISPDVDISTTS